MLEDERIVLRAITMEDTDKIVEWRNNPKVLKILFLEKNLQERFIGIG